MTGQPSPLVSLNKAGYETFISGGGTSRGGRLTRHEFQADLTQTMDYDKFMNRWITRRHEVTTKIVSISAGGLRCGKKNRGQQFTHSWGCDEI